MPVPIPSEMPHIDLTVRREHGIHQFPLADGGSVSVVSDNSWMGFVDKLERLDNPGSYILSPELVTITADEMMRGPDPQDMVERRVDQARNASTLYPETTLLLGSLTFTAGQKPRNELLFIRNGALVGHNPKLPYNAGEAMFFHQTYDPAEHQQPDPRTVGIICSDLLFHGRRGEYQEGLPGRNLMAEYVNPVGPDVRTILVSGLWIAPQTIPEIDPAHEVARFVDPVRFYARALMYHNPGVQDVIMADQLPVGTQARGPVNFHARRI